MSSGKRFSQATGTPDRRQESEASLQNHRKLIRELRDLLKFLRFERLTCFFFWTFADDLSYKRSSEIITKTVIQSLKRFRALLSRFNRILMTKSYGSLLNECAA